MISKLLGLAAGPWGALAIAGAVIGVVGLLITAGWVGIGKIRADAAADAKAACEARFTELITGTAYDEAIRRAEVAEAALRAAAILSARDASAIDELHNKVDDHARERARLGPNDSCLLTDDDIRRLQDLRR